MPKVSEIIATFGYYSFQVCESPTKILAYMINSRNAAIVTDAQLSILKVAEEESTSDREVRVANSVNGDSSSSSRSHSNPGGSHGNPTSINIHISNCCVSASSCCSSTVLGLMSIVLLCVFTGSR